MKKLDEALKAIPARVDDAVKKACEEEAQRLRDRLLRKHFAYMTLMYHTTKRQRP